MQDVETRETFPEELWVDLTDEEKIEMGRDLAGCREEVRSLKRGLKDTTDRVADTMKGVEARARKLDDALLYGRVKREVQCYERSDYAAGVVRIYRDDTGEEVRFRNMSEAERQVPLSFGSANNDGAESTRLSGLLNWSEGVTSTGREVWEASSRVFEEPFSYEVKFVTDGVYALDCDVELYLAESDSDRVFSTLAEAQRFCELTEEQHRNDAKKKDAEPVTEPKKTRARKTKAEASV